jgi:hypothetical protein
MQKSFGEAQPNQNPGGYLYGEFHPAALPGPAGRPSFYRAILRLRWAVCGGIHAADGYAGTPSSEVIDRGLSQVQDLIKWVGR